MEHPNRGSSDSLHPGHFPTSGGECPDAPVDVRNSLGLVLQDQGKYEAAEKLHQQALSASKKT